MPTVQADSPNNVFDIISPDMMVLLLNHTDFNELKKMEGALLRVSKQVNVLVSLAVERERDFVSGKLKLKMKQYEKRINAHSPSGFSPEEMKARATLYKLPDTLLNPERAGMGAVFLNYWRNNTNLLATYIFRVALIMLCFTLLRVAPEIPPAALVIVFIGGLLVADEVARHYRLAAGDMDIFTPHEELRFASAEDPQLIAAYQNAVSTLANTNLLHQHNDMATVQEVLDSLVQMRTDRQTQLSFVLTEAKTNQASLRELGSSLANKNSFFEVKKVERSAKELCEKIEAHLEQITQFKMD